MDEKKKKTHIVMKVRKENTKQVKVDYVLHQ